MARTDVAGEGDAEVALAPGSGSWLLQRRQSYDRIPRFFFPRTEAAEGPVVQRSSHALCRQRAVERVDELLLTAPELKRLTDAICANAYAPKLTSLQKVLLGKTAAPSAIACVDRLRRDAMVLLLSYADWKVAAKVARSDKVATMMAAQVFLMLPQDGDEKVNGITVLEYLYELHRALTATRFVLSELDASTDGMVREAELEAVVQRFTMQTTKDERLLAVDAEFQSYYVLICTRMVLLRHDFTAGGGAILMDDLVACPVFLEWFQLAEPSLRSLFVVVGNRFHPDAVRNIHRQYLQLDRDKNGLLSADEVVDFGKKKAFNPIEQTPTHDLTRAFVTRVFGETPTFPPHDEMDYKAYIDFTVCMADRSSLAALRFFWTILDTHKQGYLDAATLDYFLTDLVAKIREHGSSDLPADETPLATVARLRTQVFDLVAPRDPLRISWRDLVACRLGHLVVRMLTDCVAYRAYEACDGRFHGW